MIPIYLYYSNSENMIFEMLIFPTVIIIKVISLYFNFISHHDSFYCSVFLWLGQSITIHGVLRMCHLIDFFELLEACIRYLCKDQHGSRRMSCNYSFFYFICQFYFFIINIVLYYAKIENTKKSKTIIKINRNSQQNHI